VSNNPIGLTDPAGLSAQDFQQIIDRCKKCIKQLDSIGGRRPGEGVLNGWANDLSFWGHSDTRCSCFGQAQYVQPCMGSHPKPFDDRWNFYVKHIGGGTHWVVVGYSSNKSDLAVVCDPWLNRTSTFRPVPNAGEDTFPTGSLPVIRVQTDKPQMRKLRRVSFHGRLLPVCP
jgi:hypothetical protein